jgi:hypothetical protein
MNILKCVFKRLVTKSILMNIVTILMLAIFISFEVYFVEGLYTLCRFTYSVIFDLLGFTLLRVIDSYFISFKSIQRHTNSTKTLACIF